MLHTFTIIYHFVQVSRFDSENNGVDNAFCILLHDGVPGSARGRSHWCLPLRLAHHWPRVGQTKWEHPGKAPGKPLESSGIWWNLVESGGRITLFSHSIT